MRSERAHRLERDRALVTDGGLGRLVRGRAQRDGAPLPVAGGVDDDALAGRRRPKGDPVRDVLDRVDRLAVVADQQAEVITDELAGHAFLVLVHADLGVDAESGDPLEQFLDARGGLVVAASIDYLRRPERFFFLRGGRGGATTGRRHRRRRHYRHCQR